MLSINLRQAVTALAEALGLVGVDEKQHGERVSYMALNCAQVLGWDKHQQSHLFSAGLLHDCGVSSTRVHTRLVTELDWDGSEKHCIDGEWLLSQFRPLAHLAPVIRYHHTHWDKLATMSIEGEVALQANLIYLADRVDALIAQYQAEGQRVPFEQVRSRIESLAGTFFKRELVDAFLKASGNDAFWLNLEPQNIIENVQEISMHGTETIDNFADLRALAVMFAHIVDAKSHFTYDHSLGVANLATHIGEQAGLSPERVAMVEIAALLHDLGKLGVPDEILEKPARLNAEETTVMHRHSYDTYRILRHIDGLEEIAEWAGNHHETLLGNGYPFQHQKQELSLETRVIIVADIFQALAQERPYRSSMKAEDIMQILREMAADGRIDDKLVAIVDSQSAYCWQLATQVADCTE